MNEIDVGSIAAAATGPLLVRGPVLLTDAAGNDMWLAKGRSTALCRCGQSATKPFCDGAHRNADFEAAAPAPGWALERFAPPPEL